MNPTAALLIIGNEVLSGRTPDANLNYIARRLTETGINLVETRVVKDDTQAIIRAVNELRKTHTHLFTTGGIGPTHDDITIETIAKAFGTNVQRNPQVEAKLKEFYSGRYTAATLRMADFPAGSRIIWHGENFAPGCIMENVIILAGSPRYMQVMFEAALPLLNQGTPLHTRQIDVWVYESAIAESLAAIQSRFPQVDIGSYPYRIEGKAGTALVARGEDPKQVDQAFHLIEEMLQEKQAQPRTA